VRSAAVEVQYDRRLRVSFQSHYVDDLLTRRNGVGPALLPDQTECTNSS